MGIALVAAVVYFMWPTVLKRDDALATPPTRLLPFASSDAALNAMPDVVHTRPWRTCTDEQGRKWSVHGTNTTKLPRGTMFAGEAFTRPEWILGSLDAVQSADHADGDAGQQQQAGAQALYHVPYLEAWADAATGASRGGEELERQAKYQGDSAKLMSDEMERLRMSKGNQSEVAPEQVDATVRDLLDVKPGVFAVERLNGGGVSVTCPQGIGA